MKAINVYIGMVAGALISGGTMLAFFVHPVGMMAVLVGIVAGMFAFAMD